MIPKLYYEHEDSVYLSHLDPFTENFDEMNECFVMAYKKSIRGICKGCCILPSVNKRNACYYKLFDLLKYKSDILFNRQIL